MTIVLRLQGLNVKAGLEDIREFFKCLYIPEGGVYILGGRLGEAFIAFTSKTHADLAMQYSGKLLKGSKVTIRSSSMAELEHNLKSWMKKKNMNKKKKEHSTTKLTVKKPQSSPDQSLPSLNTLIHDHDTANPQSSTARPVDPRSVKPPQPLYSSTANDQTSGVNSLDPNTAFLLGICTVLGLQSSHQNGNTEVGLRFDSPKADATPVVSDVVRTPETSQNSGPGYVRLFGLPASATKDDICKFFSGLVVQEAIVNVKLGVNNGCLVKFANTQDACDALRFNKQSLGPICVEVRGATEKMWTSVLQECEDAFADDDKREKLHPNPLRETANCKQKSTISLQKKRCIARPPFRLTKKPKVDCDSTTLSPTTEYIIMVNKLPKIMNKTEIKDLFGCQNIAHKNVQHLLDKEGNRTDTAFLIFNRSEDYDYAINLTGCHVGSNTIEVSSITREKMRDMMAKIHFRSRRTPINKNSKQKRKSLPTERPQERPKLMTDWAAQTCLYVRNMPAGVNKKQIRSLFSEYNLRKNDITLLHDSDGHGIGEAVVQFKHRNLAALAHGLSCQEFLGTQVLLTLINVQQKEDIVAQNA